MIQPPLLRAFVSVLRSDWYVSLSLSGGFVWQALEEQIALAEEGKSLQVNTTRLTSVPTKHPFLAP